MPPFSLILRHYTLHFDISHFQISFISIFTIDISHISFIFIIYDIFAIDIDISLHYYYFITLRCHYRYINIDWCRLPPFHFIYASPYEARHCHAELFQLILIEGHFHIDITHYWYHCHFIDFHYFQLFIIAIRYFHYYADRILIIAFRFSFIDWYWHINIIIIIDYLHIDIFTWY
jgi:hypothetical protein